MKTAPPARLSYRRKSGICARLNGAFRQCRSLTTRTFVTNKMTPRGVGQAGGEPPEISIGTIFSHRPTKKRRVRTYRNQWRRFSFGVVYARGTAAASCPERRFPHGRARGHPGPGFLRIWPTFYHDRERPRRVVRSMEHA